MLRILTGRAGSGKTTEIFRRMAAEGQQRKQILLVPEQASFETEQRFCRENGNRAGVYGEVLSFTRLENRVLTLAGGVAQPVLDEGGRLLTMYAALRSVSAHLTVYAMPSRRPEFLGSLLTTMDELKSCCVTGEALAQVGEETEGLDGQKLRDLGLIFGAYEARTARGALDPRDRLTRLAQKLSAYPFFQEKDVYLDGFTDFTPQQRLVLEQILKQAHSVTVSLTWDGGAEEEAVFAPAGKTIAVLSRLAKKGHRTVKREHLSDSGGHRTLPLDYAERTLFTQSTQPYDGPWDSSVTTVNLVSPREEIAWVAGEIQALVRSGLFRYRDIAVAARSMDGYWEQLEDSFAQYNIPLFQADKTDILQKPIFTLITAALDSVTGGYTYDDVFRYLKTGLTGLTPEDCDRLENYVLTWDIRGRQWTAEKGWKRNPRGWQKETTPEDEAELTALNALRLRVIAPLEQLKKNAGDTIGEQVVSLYKFLEEIQAPEALEARSAALLERGEPELAREYSQLWEIFCGALEQCVAMVGEMESSLSDFSRLLRLLLSRYTVGTIPASLDRVTAGDAQRLGGRACQVIFLVGADDSSIPQVTPGLGLLTDHDREILEGYGLELAPRTEEKLSREYTIVYTTCAQPARKLYVTWPAQGETGGEKRPSFLIERLETLFPQCQRREKPAPSPDQLRSLAAGVPSIRAALSEDPRSAALFRHLDQAARWQRGRLSPGAVSALYGKKVPMSASRMDQYQSCHFAYFLRYGLDARARRPAGFDAPEYGTFVHYVLEHVLRAIQDQGGAAQVSDEAIQGFATQAVRDYVHGKLGGMEHQTPRFRYLFRRLEKGVRAVVENVVAELRSSDFQPLWFELGFGYGPDKSLPPVNRTSHGITLSISGFVDRVDGWRNEKDGRLYLRVVDYKTGRKSFDLTEVWNGLGLQLLLYLFTLEREGSPLFGEQPVPAGVLYLPAREAVLKGSRTMDEAARQKELDKELLRKGLILEDADVVEAMEHGEGSLRFLPVKVKTKKDETTISGDALVSAEKLGRLDLHIQTILSQICQEIARGNIDADPFWRSKEQNACTYCEFAQACQFEESAGATGDHRRWAPTVENKTFWAKLSQTEEGGEPHGRQTNP